MKGVDYSSGRPSGAALAAAGVGFAARYVSHTSSKNITASEAADLAAHGVWTVLVWETTANRAGAGKSAGIADATEALAQATAAGMPAGRPLYFAVDWDANPSVVVPYFQGVASVLGLDRTGAYGGYKVIKYLLDHGLIAWAWQTAAWSGGQWDARAHIRQPATTVRINGVACDNDTSQQEDFGQWMPGNITPEDDVALSDADKTWLTNAINSAIAAKLPAVWSADGSVPAARPPYNNADYYKADGKTLNNTSWTAGYASQTTVEGVRECIALLNDIKTTLGAVGAGGLADQIAQQLSELEITVTKKESTS